MVLSPTASDPDPGDNFTYLWRQVAGPASATGIPPTSLNAVASNLLVGTYQFGFTATDQKGGKSTEDFVVVTVNPAPSTGGSTLLVNSSKLNQNVVAENLSWGERVSPLSTLDGLAVTGAGQILFTQYSGLGGSAQKPTEGGSGNVLTGGVLTKVEFAAGQMYTLAAPIRAANAFMSFADSIGVSVGASGVGKGLLPVLRGQLGATWDVAVDSYGYRGQLLSMIQNAFLTPFKQARSNGILYRPVRPKNLRS